MKITIFGSASGIPEKGKSQTCIGVEVGERIILLDVGEGSASSIAGEGIEVDKIEKIFISHAHVDHFIGLPMLLQYFKRKGRRKTLEVYLPAGHIGMFEKFLPFVYIFKERLGFESKFLPLRAGKLFVFEDLSITVFPTKHLQEYVKYAELYGIDISSYGYLIEEKTTRDNGEATKRFLFSSDLYSVEEIKSYLDELDLLVIECSHIEVEDIIELASDFYIPKIVLTHVSPEKDIAGVLEYASSKFSIDFRVAYDGMKIEI